jgi:hypothetical protein
MAVFLPLFSVSRHFFRYPVSYNYGILLAILFQYPAFFAVYRLFCSFPQFFMIPPLLSFSRHFFQYPPPPFCRFPPFFKNVVAVEHN